MAEVNMGRSSLDINNLPSNSNTSKVKTERPKPKPVLSKPAAVKKQTLGHKFINMFLGDEIEDVKSYILKDVVIPTIKNTILDVVCGGAEMLLLGRTSSRRHSGRGQTYTPYASYGTYYTNQQNYRQPQNASPQPNRYGVDDIIFNTYQEASDVLAAMFDYMHDYDGMISVADYYEMVRHPSVYTDNSWGWTDLGGASIRRVRDGYLLVLPRAIGLN